MDAQRQVRALACWGLCALLFAISSSLSAQAQSLRLGDIVDGSLQPGQSESYTFSALALTLLSIRVEALDDTLDPRFELRDRDGRLIIDNDDYDYPATRDAAIQALVLEDSSTYSIIVSGHGGSGGSYRLHLLPGFDVLALRDVSMDQAQWQAAFSDTELTIAEASPFAVALQGYARTGVILAHHLPPEQDIYFEAAFDDVASSVGWHVGLVFRFQSPQNYHRLLFSKTGYWRIERVESGQTVVIRGWKTHPAIVPGESDFRLGILASGRHFDVVYKGQVVGSVADEAAARAGGLGIIMRTDDVNGGAMSFAIRESLLTLPTRVKGKILFPQRILQRLDYLMAHDLARKQLAPAGYNVSFVQRESSVRHVRPGVTRIAIAPDRQAEQFALGAALTFAPRGDGNAGCGLFFHFNDENHYSLAYMTSQGDYGLSRRSGQSFAPGIYGQRQPPAGQEHYLLVIATDEIIHYYLDEVYVGSLPSQPRVGSIGIAVVNYDAVDSECRFDDLWLQSFDA